MGEAGKQAEGLRESWPCKGDVFSERIGGEEWLPSFCLEDAKYLASCLAKKESIDEAEVLEALKTVGMVQQEPLVCCNVNLEVGKVSKRWRVAFDPSMNWYSLLSKEAGDWYEKASLGLGSTNGKERRIATQKLDALAMVFSFEPYAFVTDFQKKIAFFRSIRSCMKVSPRFVDFHVIAARWFERCKSHPVDVAPEMDVLDLVETTVATGRKTRVSLLPNLELLTKEQLDFFHLLLFASPAAFLSKRKLFWKTHGYPAAHGLQTRSEAIRQPLKGGKRGVVPSHSPASSSENLDLLSAGSATPLSAGVASHAPTTEFPLCIEVPFHSLRSLGLTMNWKRNMVASVTQGYAQQQGVEPGMVLDLVDGHSASKDVFRGALASAKAESRSLSLTFRINVSDNAVRRITSQLQFAGGDWHRLLQSPAPGLSSLMNPDAPAFSPLPWSFDYGHLLGLYGESARDFLERLQVELLALDKTSVKPWRVVYVKDESMVGAEVGDVQICFAKMQDEKPEIVMTVLVEKNEIVKSWGANQSLEEAFGAAIRGMHGQSHLSAQAWAKFQTVAKGTWESVLGLTGKLCQKHAAGFPMPTDVASTLSGCLPTLMRRQWSQLSVRAAKAGLLWKSF